MSGTQRVGVLLHHQQGAPTLYKQKHVQTLKDSAHDLKQQ